MYMIICMYASYQYNRVHDIIYSMHVVYYGPRNCTEIMCMVNSSQCGPFANTHVGLPVDQNDNFRELKCIKYYGRPINYKQYKWAM